MIKERDFIQNKKQTLETLDNAIKENLVDKKIIPIINLINSNKNYYTSSSCYGRIVVLEIPSIGDKKNAKFLDKFHREIKESEMFNSLKKATKGQLWLLAQAPIIHVFSKDLESGDILVKKAVSCGFKNSGFRSISKNIVIEITSTERLDAPIGVDGVLYYEKEYIPFLVNIANNVIKKSTKKLNQFKKEVSTL